MGVMANPGWVDWVEWDSSQSPANWRSLATWVCLQVMHVTRINGEPPGGEDTEPLLRSPVSDLPYGAIY